VEKWFDLLDTGLLVNEGKKLKWPSKARLYLRASKSCPCNFWHKTLRTLGKNTPPQGQVYSRKLCPKLFITLTPGPNIINLFTSTKYEKS